MVPGDPQLLAKPPPINEAVNEPLVVSGTIQRQTFPGNHRGGRVQPAFAMVSGHVMERLGPMRALTASGQRAPQERPVVPAPPAAARLPESRRLRLLVHPPGIPAALREAKDTPAAFRRAGERHAHDGQRFRAVRIASF